MRQAWGQATDLVALLLKQTGQATHWALAEDAELPEATVRKALQRMSSGPMLDRRAHVCGWTLDAEGRRRYWRAVYAYGPGPNAKRPPALGHTAAVRNYSKRATSLAMSMLGTYVRQADAKRLVAAARRSGAPL